MGLSIGDATDTMSSLANPGTYAYLARRRGWTPARIERRLADRLALLLLPLLRDSTAAGRRAQWSLRW